MRRSISQTRKKYLQATWGNCWVELKQTVKRLFNDIYVFAEDNILLSMTYWKKELFTTNRVIHFNDIIKDIVICNKAILHFPGNNYTVFIISQYSKIEKFTRTITNQGLENDTGNFIKKICKVPLLHFLNQR